MLLSRRSGVLLLTAAVVLVLGGEAAQSSLRTRHLQVSGSVQCYPKELEGEGFFGCKVLDQDALALHWRVSDDGKTIKFGAMIPGGSWLALALPQDGGGLLGADIMVLKEDKVASRTVWPAPAGFWPASMGDAPVPDPDPNTLMTHKTVGGASYFSWSRPLSSCPGVSLVAGQLSRLFWAVSTLDGWQQEELPLLGAVGYASEILMKPAVYQPADMKTVAASMKNAKVTAPGVSLCTLVEVPNDVKYHVYQMEWRNASATGIIEAGMYDCFLQTTLEHQVGVAWDCSDELSLGRCPAVAHYVPNSGVLPGTPVLLETLDAAYPVGKGYAKYLVMSVTYGEVPAKIVDNTSGFNMRISPTLRANDIGMMVTGAPYSTRNNGLVVTDALVSSLRVPKGADEVDYMNSCPASCVGKLLPAGSKMIASRMIMRKLGTSGVIESVSAKGERHTLHYNRVNDPTYPGLNLYTTPVALDPTNTIVTTCVYNSKNATTDATWGVDLQCLGVIYYAFPRSEKTFGGSCFNVLGASLPTSLAQYKEKDVGLCTIGKERSFALSTPLETLSIADGVKKKAFTAHALAVRNQPACAKAAEPAV